ncbi:uncharacterized protein LOC135950054 [Calliphora vicina]|uniref:uncharacterized protein LOC135950054 n=1 Tax=Calliphora vicina TaxID=7373 RepID=UPI00325B4E14
MDAASAVVTVPASSATASATTTPTSSNAINVNQSNNHIHTHTNTHSGANSLSATTNSSNSSSNNSNISIGGNSSNSSNSNSSCSSSSTSSNSSGYGSTTTTPTNNYDLQQQTTPTTTPIPTTPVAIAEPIIPVATVAAVTPYYNESITTHNLETHQLQHHPPHHTQQQQLQQHQHQLLQPNHHLQLPQNHLQANLQPQQHQYLPRQQYYSTYDYQQPAPTHNLSGSSALTAAAAYNVGVTGPYELSSPAYGSGQYKSSSLSGAINYERAGIRTNTAATSYNHQQQQQTEQQQSKTINQQTQQFPAVLASSKQRSSSLIGNSTSTNTSKPQAAATPFYAQPLASQSHSNPTPFYDNTKYKMPLEYHDSYGNPSAAAAASYHQQQKYYAAAKSQLKEAAYGAVAGLNSKSVYPNTANFFPGPAANHGLPATSYDKYMYPHASTTGYSASGHMGNETPPEVSSYRKPVVANSMNSPSWPWGIDYASGNSRTIPPPPASHLPTATVAPTHATYLQPNPTALTRDPYYMAHDKYAVKYDKYAAPSYQQSYVSPPSSRHHLWPSTAHASNLTQLNERHMLASAPTAPPSHGLHTTPYFPNNSTAGLNSRQSCCSQPYQPQSCYYPSSHAIPPRLPHNQSNSVAAPSSGYLTSQQTLGQSPHLNALTASCKYGGVIPDYGNGNKIKNSNDLYLNAHHYDNNTSPHTYGYGSAHSSQQLYASNAHQSMAHGLTPSSLLTHDPLNANQASYTNDLSLTTSNFDNYHTHLDPHLSPQTLAGIHGQQPPPAYGPTVAKRALLDYRKPIQPQPPPTIAEECYTTLSSRDHYNQQELLNTPETTTTFAEYEAQQNNASSLSSYSHTPEALADAEKANDEGNKNLSLRDFIANWNDDEDEFQNNEELNFDQANVIDEVLQTAPVEQAAAAAAAVEDSEIIKTSSLDSKNTEHSLLKSHKIVENLDAQTLSDQYVNLPDIVIDIEKSNNVNNSITTPSTSPTPNTQQEANSFPPNLNNFDVEKELDELKLKKPTQQELTKDLNDINDTNSVTTPQLSPCKNLTTQLSFEDLNLEPANKTVLNATAPTTTTTRLTNQQSSELTETYFKDMEGYESGSSRHSNESAFEKEYETFINKITSNASVNKNTEEKSNEADKEMDFEQNVQDFSKFYKRKRKLKEDELKTSLPETPGHKKLKTNVATKVYNSNFPQVYTKKSRNRLNKAKQQTPHKRKPLSVYYKVIHSIRRFGLHRLKRVREYMTELKDKHLPLIKRQSIKNYTHGLPDNLFNAKSLKALCIMAINTEEFRQRLMLSIEDQESCLQTEEKHICTDPTCETCEVIKSLMEAESFEESLLQQVCENNTETLDISSAILCEEGKLETITIVDNAEIISFHKEEPTMISNEIENVQYSKEIVTEFETELLVSPNETNINKSETEFDLNNWYEKSKSPEQNLQTKEYSEIPLQRESAIANCNKKTSLTQHEKEAKDDLETESSNCGAFNQINQIEAADAKLVSQTTLCDNENLNISTASKDIKEPEIPTTAEFNESSNTTLKTVKIEAEKFSHSKNQESESDDSDSSESDSDSSSSSSDDESFDDSKDSHKKSDSNDKSSDTDSESDLENDDEKVNSDSNQSYHSVNNKRKQNIASKVDKELVKPFDLTKSENMEQSSDRKYNEINEPKKASLKFNPVNKNRDVNTDSDTEDEIIPKSPQHIVIRIKKSFKLSPNKNSSREVYVSENSLKSYGKFDNQSETESEDEDISEKECEVISTTLKLSPKQNKSLDDNVSENSVSSESELENQTKSESEDDDIIKKKVKFSPKQVELAKENVMEPDNELDKHRETESEDDEISKKKIKLSPKQEALATEQLMEPHTELESESKGEDISENESKIVSTSLQLSPKQEDSLEDHVPKNPIQPNTELDNHTESESEDGDTAVKETEIVSASLELSSKQKDSIESLAIDKPIEPQTEFDNHTESECEDDDNLDKESKMITKKEDSIEDHATENPHTESDNHTESESDEDDISENEMVSKNIKLCTKKEDSIEDHSTEKPIEPHTESDNHSESESDEDDISENEMVSKPLTLSTKQEDSIEDHATETPIEPHTESDNHVESESDEDDISEKEYKTPLNLSPKNKDSIKDDVSEKSFESHTEFDKQSESEDDEISEKESKIITISLTQKHDNFIEENAEPTESDSEDDEILQRNCEINVTSLKLSPIQNDNAEFDDQIEEESEVDNKKDKEMELISNSLKFIPKQGDCTDQPTSPKSELESHTENPTKCDALYDDFEKESDILTTTSDLSPTAQNSMEECTPEKSADLSHEAEVFAIEKPAEFFTELDKHTESKSEDDSVDDISKDKSNFLELSQKADDVKIDEFSKKSTQECIEVNDLIESQYEDDDTDDEEDLPLEQSDINVQHKDADHTIILSDSDSSSYSESESDNEDEDVAMKSIKTSNDSIPIMISDDESMHNSFDNVDSQKSTNISEDSLNEIKSDTELTESNDSEKSLIDGDNNDLLRNSQERIMNEDSNFPSNKLDPEIPEPAKTTEETMPANEDISLVNDPEIPELARTTEETMPTNEELSPPDSKIVEDHKVSNNVIESAEEFSSNINSPQEDLPLDCVEINQTQTINDEKSCEKCISEYSSSSEDSDEDMDDKLSTKDDQGTENQSPPEPLLQNIEDQESIHSENNYSECEKNAAVAQESNNPDAVLETNFSKINQNSPKMAGCESERPISSIHSPDENELLQKSEELNEDLNSLEETSRIPENLSEQTNENKAVIALSETVLNETCENLEILADTVKNFTTDNLENALSETIPEETQEILTDDTVKNFATEPEKISDNLENEDQNKIKEGSSIINENISEESNSQGCEDHEHFEREETIAQTANTDDSNILEEVNGPTSESSKETPDIEERQEDFEREETIAQTTNTDDSNIPEDVNSPTPESSKDTPDIEESQTNSKAITEELIVLDKIPAETKETNADSMVKDIDSETITEESNFVKTLNDTSATFDEISCENPSIDDPPTEDCENISETKTSESKESDNETIAESITEKSETADLSVDINNEPLETLKEIYYKEDTNTEFVTETSAIISQIVTEESEYLEKVNSEEACNPKDITGGNINEESAITEESNNRLSPDSLKISDKIISKIGTEVLDIIPQEISKDSDILDNNQTLEISENTTEHCTNLDANVINESESLEKSCDDEVIVWKEALQTVEHMSAGKEVESPVTVSEPKPETLELAEEPNTESSEVFEEDYDQANESLNNLEDTDIFKEVMQEDLGSSQETFDEKESNNESLIKNSAADPVNDISEILEHEKDHTISEPKPETLELAEEANTQSSAVFEEGCEQAAESLDNLEDTDIFKEVMQEDLGKSNETFDEKESHKKSLTKDSAIVPVADASDILEQEKDHTTSEPKPETTEFAEEPNSQSSEIFEEDCEQAAESLDNLEDTDIFKEVMQEDLGSSQETFDENKSNNESLTKDSTIVSVADVAEILEQAEDSMTNNEAIVEKAESLEETINKSSEIVKGFETSCEKVIEKPNTLIEDENENSECIEQVSIPMNERLSESDVLVEVPNKCIEDKNDDSEPEAAAEEPKKTIEDKYEMTECYKDSGAVHGYLSKSEEENEESDPSHKSLSKSEAVVKKPNSLVEDKIENSACYEEDHILSKLAKPSTSIADNNVTFESYEVETHSKDDELVALKSQTDAKPLAEHQAENLECSFKESLGENVNSVSPEENESIEDTALPKDDELVAEKLQAEEPLSAAHQIGDLERSLNESLTENVSNKDSNTQEDLSGDFLGFKNQSSFEDESEDFHGFEDLEEVARIRQEIENINDDSTANDGFRNYANLNRDLHKSSTTSLTGSTASEINELEALEKELSQHQTEMEEENEDEDKETDNELQTQTVKIVSSNDIEHIKQMLESDEELQQDEIEVMADADNSKDKFVENSKLNSNDILSSVNSIIPKLSDLCRAALNSSLNSNSNLAQHTETPTILVERELSVEEALAEMYRQAGVLLSDPEDCDNDIATDGRVEEAHDVLLINLQEILNSDNNEVYVLQCDMNENLLNVVQQTAEEQRHEHQDSDVVDDTERVNTVQFIGILDTQSTEPQIHIISSDSESEVIILSDDESDFGYRPFIARQERITIPFINDNDINDCDSLSDISTIHHEEIVPDNLNKFLEEEFYKYLHEKYVQRNISKYYHANRVLKKYRKRFVKTKRQ